MKKDSGTLISEAKAALEKKKYSAARNILLTARKINPDSCEILFELGKLYFLTGNNASAAKFLRNALKCDPRNSHARILLGKIYRSQKRYDRAVQELRKNIRRRLNLEETHSELGYIYFEQDSTRKAVSELSSSLNINPQNPQANETLGDIHQSCSENMLAIHHFEKALKSDPSRKHIYLKLARLYDRENSHTRTIEMLKKSLESGWAKDHAYIRLGELYRRTAQYELALKMFKAAEKNSSGRDSLRFKNRILNEIEITQKKTIIRSKPRWISFALSSRCDLDCYMCGLKEAFRNNEWDMPAKVLDELFQWLPHMEHVHWLGGEPFIYRNFKNIFLEAAKNDELLQMINTNALNIDGKWAEELAGHRVTLKLSIDSIQKETYEGIRKGARFERLLKNIELIHYYRDKKSKESKGRKLKTFFYAVIMRNNYRELENFVRFAIHHRFDAVEIVPLSPDSLKNRDNIYLYNNRTAAEFLKKKIPAVSRLAEQNKIEFCNMLPDPDLWHLYPRDDADGTGTQYLKKGESLKRSLLFGEDELFCTLPWQSLTIYCGGSIVPANRYCRKEIGNILENSLEEIWNGEPVQLYRKAIIQNNLEHACGKCVPSYRLGQDELI
ncbi:MAG TPA: tetratricopeptide repeat protein [bacterium]|nr:tetratricopeptide repeat protein [bacterium]